MTIACYLYVQRHWCSRLSDGFWYCCIPETRSQAVAM